MGCIREHVFTEESHVNLSYFHIRGSSDLTFKSLDKVKIDSKITLGALFDSRSIGIRRNPHNCRFHVREKRKNEALLSAEAKFGYPAVRYR